MTELLNLTKRLIERHSITPNDMGCQKLIAAELQSAGFTCEYLNFGEVSNLYAWHGTGKPSLIFAGHTDVVPAGETSAWQFDPFTPTEKNGYLYGRGAADMKAAVAAMVLSAKNYVLKKPKHAGRIGLVITSDEEGVATHGTVKVVEHLQQQGLIPDYVIVGEASSNEQVGDAIKIGRRGSMHGILTIHGVQGHIAFPQHADNPIHRCLKAFDKLAHHTWDSGNAYFPPTAFQFYDIQAGIGAENVIPGKLTAKFNFRYSPMSEPESLQKTTEQILDEFKLQYHLKFNVSSLPYFSGDCELSTIAIQAIQDVVGISAQPNALGGTSDGRHFAPHGCQVIEVGAVNKTIHKVDECISISQLQQLLEIYQTITRLVLG